MEYLRSLSYQSLDGSGVTLSHCGKYRYELWRRWAEGPFVLWVMLNPSTADATKNDPTIRRCIGFSKAWGYSGLMVVNLFALRATDPGELKRAQDPVGPMNDWHIERRLGFADRVVAAWGTRGRYMDRDQSIKQLARKHERILHALKLSKSGDPGHPLYLKADLTPFRWDGAWNTYGL